MPSNKEMIPTANSVPLICKGHMKYVGAFFVITLNWINQIR